MPRTRGTVRRVVAMVASGLMAVMVGVPLAVPASAEELYTACSWTGTQTQDDRTCTGAVFDYGGQVTRSTCWQYRPSDRSSKGGLPG